MTAVQGRLAKSLIVVLLIVSIGGHWVFLQSIAWATMILDYSKDAPIAVAVSKTFDGKHPCNLCKLVKHGKEHEEKQDAVKQKVKLESWMIANAIAFESPRASAEPIDFSPVFFQSHSSSPPLPPPRRA